MAWRPARRTLRAWAARRTCGSRTRPPQSCFITAPGPSIWGSWCGASWRASRLGLPSWLGTNKCTALLCSCGSRPRWGTVCDHLSSFYQPSLNFQTRQDCRLTAAFNNLTKSSHIKSFGESWVTAMFSSSVSWQKRLYVTETNLWQHWKRVRRKQTFLSSGHSGRWVPKSPFYLPEQPFWIEEVLLSMTAKHSGRQNNKFTIILSPECAQMCSRVSVQVEPEKLKTLTHDLEALDRAAKRGLK